MEKLELFIINKKAREIITINTDKGNFLFVNFLLRKPKIKKTQDSS